MTRVLPIFLLAIRVREWVEMYLKGENPYYGSKLAIRIREWVEMPIVFCHLSGVARLAIRIREWVEIDGI